MSSQVSLVGAHRVNVFEHNTGGRMNKVSTRDSSGMDYLLVLPFPGYRQEKCKKNPGW